MGNSLRSAYAVQGESLGFVYARSKSSLTALLSPELNRYALASGLGVTTLLTRKNNFHCDEVTT